MKDRSIQIIPFKVDIPKYLAEVVHLDAVCLSEYTTAWKEENFLLDLPQKGQLSKLAISPANLIGFLICSSYQNQEICHIHRLAVHPDYRRLGIAQRLFEESLRECLNLRINGITTETPNSDIPAKNFYIKLGFQPLRGTNLEEYLINKDKTQQAAQYSARMKGTSAYFLEVGEALRRLGKCL